MRRPRPSARAMAQAAAVAGAAVVLLAIAPSPAQALSLGLDKLNPFGALLDFGVKEGGKLVLSIIGGLVDLLLPDEIGKQGAAIIQWIGSGPDFGRAIKTVPSLSTLLGYSLWIGFSILPATIAFAGIRNMLGDGPPVTELAGRLLGALVVLALWPYMWQILPLLTSNITAVYLKNPSVVAGLNKYVELLVTGAAVTAALGALTWPLLALIVMGVGGFFFVSLLVFKAGLWIIGAAIYIGGPILVGFVLTDRGMAMIRSVAAVIVAIFALPIVWSMILAVTALTIGAGGKMTAVLGGTSTMGHLFGALMVGAVAIIGPGMCFALGKTVLGGVAGSVLSTARSVTARGGVSGGKTGTPAPKTAGAGASTVRAARSNATRGWNRGLGGLGPQPAGTSRMALSSMRRGGLAAAGGTVAGAIWRSHGSTLKKTVAGARSAAGEKVSRGTAAVANAIPAMQPAVAGAPNLGAVPPRPRAPRGGNDSVSPTSPSTANGAGETQHRSEDPSPHRPTANGAAAAAATTRGDRPSGTSPGSSSRGARPSTASASAGAAAARTTTSSNGTTPSPNGGGAGASSARPSTARPRRDRGTGTPAAAPAPAPGGSAPSTQASSPRAPQPRGTRPQRAPRITPPATPAQPTSRPATDADEEQA